MKCCAWLVSVAVKGRVKRAVYFPIVLSMIVLIMTGCAHQKSSPQQETLDVKSLVHKEISDPVRADKIVALMEKMNADLNRQRQAMIDSQKELQRLNSDYNTTPEQFKSLMDSAKVSRDKMRQDIMDTYFKIKALTTRQEWEALSKAEVQAMSKILKERQILPEQ
jgi:septal ring factor EnvC (AmiA/AmiB activator)